MANFSPASETNPLKNKRKNEFFWPLKVGSNLKIKLSITWRGIQPGAQFSPG